MKGKMESERENMKNTEAQKKKDRAKTQWKSPIGILAIEEDGEAITALYLDRSTDLCERENNMQESALLREAKKQLQEYFAGKRKKFDLPIKPQGTDFQRKVWTALQTIPYGETCSYGELAAKIGKPKAARAVGGANNKNPILIIIPCHRVIGADGSMVGFACGLPAKEYLLALEQKKK